MHWAARYVGIPFADEGHDFSGCHCWGLVHLILKNEAGIQTPTYAEISGLDLIRATRAFRAAISADAWRKVEAPLRIFDCLLISATVKVDRRGIRVDGHVGILIAPDRVLHVEQATHAVHVELTHVSVRHRILNFYRHRDLT